MTDLSRRGFLGGAAQIGAGVAAAAVISTAVIEKAVPIKAKTAGFGLSTRNQKGA